MAGAAAETAAPANAGPSLMVQVGLLLVMTAAALGIGWLSGGYLSPGAMPGAAPAPTADSHAAPSLPPQRAMIIPLASITTNLAAPDQVWIRLELSLLLDEAPEESDLADVIHQDILAYVRTVKMHQVESASGFQHFKADLEDIASVRSQGKVKHVLIRTLLFE